MTKACLMQHPVSENDPRAHRPPVGLNEEEI